MRLALLLLLSACTATPPPPPAPADVAEARTTMQEALHEALWHAEAHRRAEAVSAWQRALQAHDQAIEPAVAAAQGPKEALALGYRLALVRRGLEERRPETARRLLELEDALEAALGPLPPTASAP